MSLADDAARRQRKSLIEHTARALAAWDARRQFGEDSAQYRWALDDMQRPPRACHRCGETGHNIQSCRAVVVEDSLEPT